MSTPLPSPSGPPNIAMCMYLPRPPRIGYRVQSECSVAIAPDTTPTPIVMQVPYTGELLPYPLYAHRMAQIQKGNILQYKGNSAQLSKSQIYSRAARHLWTNHTTTWATQGRDGYTNPNTQWLKRAGNVKRIAINKTTGEILGETALPLSCATPSPSPSPILPPPSSGSAVNNPSVPPPPPPAPPTPPNPAIPLVPPTPPDEIVVIQDGGTLVCNTQENPCTEESATHPANTFFHPTTDSDVPGDIELLYWSDRIQTWFPRQRTTMSTSGNKFPYTSSGIDVTSISAVLPLPPVLDSIVVVVLDASASARSVLEWTWTDVNVRLPVQQFELYQNGVRVASVETRRDVSTSGNVPPAQTYSYQTPIPPGNGPRVITGLVVAIGQGAYSFPSNKVTVSIQ